MPSNYRRTNYQSQGRSTSPQYRENPSPQAQQNEYPSQQQSYQRRGSSYNRQSVQREAISQEQQGSYRGRTQGNMAPAPTAQMPQQRRTSNRYQAVPVGNRYSNGRYGQQNQRSSAYAPAQQRYQQQQEQRQEQWDRPSGRYGLDYEEDYQSPERYQNMYEEEMPMQQEPHMNRDMMEDYENQEPGESKALSIAIGALGGALVVGIIFVLLYLHETGVF